MYRTRKEKKNEKPRKKKKKRDKQKDKKRERKRDKKRHKRKKKHKKHKKNLKGKSEAGTKIEHFMLSDPISESAFGTIYKALNLETGEHVAVKSMPLERIPKNELKTTIQEIDLLKKLNNKHIVKYLGSTKTKNRLYIILEYIESGSLSELRKGFKQFHEKLVSKYIYQTLKGLIYLHSQGVIHRNIKAANLMSTKSGIIKLTDFGVSSQFDQQNQMVDHGSVYWMAPEVIESKSISPSSDIWSLGCTIIELLTGKPPLHDINPLRALYRIVKDDHPPLPKSISSNLRSFLLECFQKDKNLRISASRLIQHPWIKSSINALSSNDSISPSSLEEKELEGGTEEEEKMGSKDNVSEGNDDFSDIFEEELNRFHQSTLKKIKERALKKKKKIKEKEKEKEKQNNYKSKKKKIDDDDDDDMGIDFSGEEDGQENDNNNISTDNKFGGNENKNKENLDDFDEGFDEDFDEDFFNSSKSSEDEITKPKNNKFSKFLQWNFKKSKKADPNIVNDFREHLLGGLDELDDDDDEQNLNILKINLQNQKSINSKSNLKHSVFQKSSSETEDNSDTDILNSDNSSNTEDEHNYGLYQNNNNRKKNDLNKKKKSNNRSNINNRNIKNKKNNNQFFERKISKSKKQKSKMLQFKEIHSEDEWDDSFDLNTQLNKKKESSMGKKIENKKFSKRLQSRILLFKQDSSLSSLRNTNKARSRIRIQKKTRKKNINKNRYQNRNKNGNRNRNRNRNKNKTDAKYQKLEDAFESSETSDFNKVFSSDTDLGYTNHSIATMQTISKREKLERETKSAIRLISSLNPDHPEEVILEICTMLIQKFKAIPGIKNYLIKYHAVIPIMEMLELTSPFVILSILQLLNQIIYQNRTMQQNLCLVGAVPLIMKFSTKDFSLDIRKEASNFFWQICHTSTITLQMFISCRGLPILVELLKLNYYNQKNILFQTIENIDSVFELKSQTPKNDFCRLFINCNLLEPLMSVFEKVIQEKNQKDLFVNKNNIIKQNDDDDDDDDDENKNQNKKKNQNKSKNKNKNKYKYNNNNIHPEHKRINDISIIISKIFFIFSKADKVVQTNLSNLTLMKKLNNILLLLKEQPLLNLLKMIKNLSMNPNSLYILEKSKIITTLVLVLNKQKEFLDTQKKNNKIQKDFKNIQNQILSALYNLCRMNTNRQEEVATAGIIPHLQTIIRDNSPLKQFSIPIICNFAKASEITRNQLYRSNGISMYMELLNFDYWRIQALDSLATCLITSRNQNAVEEILLKKDNLVALAQLFTFTNQILLANLTIPYLKIVEFSVRINTNLTQIGVISLIKTRFSHPNANVIIGLLKIIISLTKHSNNERISHYLTLNELTSLLHSQKSIIVKNLIYKLIEFCFGIEKVKELKKLKKLKKSNKLKKMKKSKLGNEQKIIQINETIPMEQLIDLN
ncbi:mtk1/mekk4 [Anaeramoeba flamelloides]|uniref:Mtk1/mekk4 n=1 Tax=Anaeramoeba flamelloides TaxID=1746091 RepID=A0AAV8AH60_9EUKA|nr:mtk1/mekk4 [Anaeramoeba flamelloides]